MVQIINDPYNGNKFGRIGKGLGQALSEQVPKEVERMRLASGLKKFEEQSSGLTPVQQFTRLAGIPGFTPEHLYTLAPLLRQQAQRQEGTNREGSKNQPLQPKGQPSQMGSSLIGEKRSNESQPVGSLKSIEATRSQLTPITKKSPDELRQEASIESENNPYTYPTPNDAMPFVQDRENTRIANLQENRNVGDVADKLQKKIKTDLEARWGKENLAKDIEPTIQANLARKIEERLADPKNKLSEQQLIDEYEKIGKGVAMGYATLKGKANSGWLGNKWKPTQVQKAIQDVRSAYEKAGGLEEFKNIIMNQYGLSDGEASAYAFPPKNERANKIVKSIPSIVRGHQGNIISGDPVKLAMQAADQLIDVIGENDSLATYALELKNRDLDPDAFFDRINQNIEAGLFTPNPVQEREIQNRIRSISSLGDILYGRKK